MSAGARATLEAALAGRYAIERELGRGGMATVYLAKDLRHDRPVAFKVLPGRRELMQPRCVNGGVHRYSMTVFPVTVQRLQAMVGPTPVVEDADTRQLPEPTSVERARLRAWLWRFVRQRGCSPVATDPVHRVVFVSFQPVCN